MLSSFIKNGVLAFGLVLGLAAHAGAAHAASASAVTGRLVAVSARPTTAPPVLFGYLKSWLGNRTRMIQVALVAVGLGILLLHKGHR